MNVHDGIGADVRDVGDGHGEARDGGPRRRRGGGNYQPTGVGDAVADERRPTRRSTFKELEKEEVVVNVHCST